MAEQARGHVKAGEVEDDEMESCVGSDEVYTYAFTTPALLSPCRFFFFFLLPPGRKEHLVPGGRDATSCSKAQAL